MKYSIPKYRIQPNEMCLNWTCIVYFHWPPFHFRKIFQNDGWNENRTEYCFNCSFGKLWTKQRTAISKCEINLIRKHRIGILTSNWKGGKYKWKSESSRITKSVNDDAGCLSSKRNFYRILKFFFSILFSSNSWNVEATYLWIGTHIDNEISWVIKL